MDTHILETTTEAKMLKDVVEMRQYFSQLADKRDRQYLPTVAEFLPPQVAVAAPETTFRQALVRYDCFTRIGFIKQPAGARGGPIEADFLLEHVFHGSHLFEYVEQGGARGELKPCWYARLVYDKRSRDHDNPCDVGLSHGLQKMARAIGVKRWRIYGG